MFFGKLTIKSDICLCVHSHPSYIQLRCSYREDVGLAVIRAIEQEHEGSLARLLSAQKNLAWALGPVEDLDCMQDCATSAETLCVRLCRGCSDPIICTHMAEWARNYVPTDNWRAGALSSQYRIALDDPLARMGGAIVGGTMKALARLTQRNARFAHLFVWDLLPDNKATTDEINARLGKLSAEHAPMQNLLRALTTRPHHPTRMWDDERLARAVPSSDFTIDI